MVSLFPMLPIFVISHNSLVFMAAMFVYKEEGIVSCSWLFRRLSLLRLSKTINRIAQTSRMALSSSVHISIFQDRDLRVVSDDLPRSYQKYQSAGVSKQILGLLAGRLHVLLNGLLSAKISPTRAYKITHYTAKVP